MEFANRSYLFIWGNSSPKPPESSFPPPFTHSTLFHSLQSVPNWHKVYKIKVSLAYKTEALKKFKTYTRSSILLRTGGMDIKSRLDLTEVFCDVDDFYRNFEKHCRSIPQLTASVGEKLCTSRLSLSEVMTIVIGFHGSGYRTFKEFYTLQVLPHWKEAFPKLVSYNRFVELMPWSMMLLCCFLQTRKGEITGISFIDSTPIEVCHPCRSKSHRVFEGLVATFVGILCLWFAYT